MFSADDLRLLPAQITAMSLPSQTNSDKSVKLGAAAMKEGVQHPGGGYYGMGAPALESGRSDPAASSGVYDADKGPQNVLHYQQAAPVKWIPQDSMQAPAWPQEAPGPAWGQNFSPYMGGVNVRGQVTFHKGVHEGGAMGTDHQLPVEVYRDPSQAQGRGLDWEQHAAAAAAAMHQAQLQAYQHGPKSTELQQQQQQQHHVGTQSLQGSMLQPFRTGKQPVASTFRTGKQPVASTFRTGKQPFPSGYYSVFPGNKALPTLAYSEPPKAHQQLMHHQQQQMHHQQQQQQQQQLQQQQQQLQLHQQLHQQLQQQQQQQQHLQQQQMQQQQMQQQYHQQHAHDRHQQIQQIQQHLQHQNVPQQEAPQPQPQPQPQSKSQQSHNFVAFPAAEPRPPPDRAAAKVSAEVGEQQQEAPVESCQLSAPPHSNAPSEQQTDMTPAAPRRSRRLSRDGQSPLGPPPPTIWSQTPKDPLMMQNGGAGVQGVRGVDGQVTTGGVIQITRRRRRASKEINLETLAQKASEMMPAQIAKDDGSSGKLATMVPLIIPVSVPVQGRQAEPPAGGSPGRLVQGERSGVLSDRNPSVIVERRRSLRNTLMEGFSQGTESDPSLDEDGKTKVKRRPRPVPLIIPPPKASTFIAPSVYSSITSYQSNLRSPVRLLDNPLGPPPYTPPPILSPVREGSGLYFSAFLTNIAVSNQILPPPPTPKSSTRSLLRSVSSDVSPPVPPSMTDATPVSLEPRINIGGRYQAQVPELQDPNLVQLDQHPADLVWTPIHHSHLKHGSHDSVKDLMNLACSSVFRGGGTNQELVLHCFHQCGGDVVATLDRLMLQDPLFSKSHHLSHYHYPGCDHWSAEEKRYFNKGISAYRKDFILVQKLVRTKAVCQCVEFYYTYKKQVKIGRNSIVTFGPAGSPGERNQEAVVELKSSHQLKVTPVEADGEERKDTEPDDESARQARVAQSLQAHDYAGTLLLTNRPEASIKDCRRPSPAQRPRADPAAKKGRVAPKADPDAVFPCKKCGRVFYKVKSRSAHMKSHAEQEKKAAALRQRLEEEQAVARARARRAAAAADGGVGNGAAETRDASSQDDSSEREDDDDEDWK